MKQIRVWNAQAREGARPIQCAGRATEFGAQTSATSFQTPHGAEPRRSGCVFSFGAVSQNTRNHLNTEHNPFSRLRVGVEMFHPLPVDTAPPPSDSTESQAVRDHAGW